MSKRVPTSEELMEAFSRLLPKQHVFPPLVENDEPSVNSCTESENSDLDGAHQKKKVDVTVVLLTEMSDECMDAWENSKLKHPEQYLIDNIQDDLKYVLTKLANLSVKPENQLEWLGYCLLNRNTQKERVNTCDHLEKPSGSLLDFTVEIGIYATEVSSSLPMPEQNRNYAPAIKKVQEQ